MVELFFDALKEIVQNEPWKVLLTLALIYMYWDLKQARAEIKEQWRLRLQDVKDLASDQNDINKTMEDLIDEVEDASDEDQG